MKDLMIIGAGRIGGAIASMLADIGDYKLTVVDRSGEQLAKIDRHPAVSTAVLDIADHASLVAALKGKFAVLSAAPFYLTRQIAEATLAAGGHYLDLTEDVVTTKEIEALAQNADRAFIPQCGLAPGFISIVAIDLASRFDSLDSVRMRVGALPQYPSNALNYNLTWSIDGLINEYIKPCEAIVEGRLVTVPAMEEREELSLDGVTYEAFNTSGGLGTLARTLEGKVRTMNYRTIRYPGHQAIIKALLNDLNLKNRRDLLKDLLENALPATMQDVVVIFVTVCGWRDGRYVQETYANKIYAGTVAGRKLSAIQITTAAGAATVFDLLAQGRLSARGFVRQEEIAMTDFLSNRFGQVYNPDAMRMRPAG
ncbi:saccharopine dehydrogenase family protein [Bradyrhizobium murdochi]|uniref:saccharopine dehydrogenase family protein n=1 Tax=Bradyrhizobium murdochi TaxID=1038859 RepID=UPI00048BFDC0|nr:saccharopine dehydrogenase family protein [Bradyrhizobium murdochi]